MLVPRALVDELADGPGFVVSHSYDANPIACAVGSAVLDEIVERDLIAAAARTGAVIRRGLDDLASRLPIIGDVRGRGSLLAIELVARPGTTDRFPADVDPGARLVVAGVDEGLLLYSRRQNGGRFGDWLLIAPPLVVDDTLAGDIVERLGRVLAGVQDELFLAAARSDQPAPAAPSTPGAT